MLHLLTLSCLLALHLQFWKRAPKTPILGAYHRVYDHHRHIRLIDQRKVFLTDQLCRLSIPLWQLEVGASNHIIHNKGRHMGGLSHLPFHGHGIKIQSVQRPSAALDVHGHTPKISDRPFLHIPVGGSPTHFLPALQNISSDFFEC